MRLPILGTAVPCPYKKLGWGKPSPYIFGNLFGRFVNRPYHKTSWARHFVSLLLDLLDTACRVPTNSIIPKLKEKKLVGAQHAEPKKLKGRDSPCGCPIRARRCRAPTKNYNLIIWAIRELPLPMKPIRARQCRAPTKNWAGASPDPYNF